MKTVSPLILFFLAWLLSASFYVSAQNPCPRTGDANTEKEQQLNKEKNKSSRFYSGRKPVRIALEKLLSAKKDREKYIPGTYVVTEGYLVSATEEGGESCNCHDANSGDKTGDVHIYLGLSANAPKKECIVVEITPSFKKLHPGYQALLAEGKKIKVYGYLLYDYLHEKNSANYCTRCAGKTVWRKTCWEIHPVVKIES